MARYIDADIVLNELHIASEKEGVKADDMAVRGVDDACIKYSHGQYCYINAQEIIKTIPTADVVEVKQIEKLKQEILQTMDDFIAEYRHISESYVDHFGGKADAMETAKRLVNASLTDICINCGAKMDVTDTNVGGK